MSKKIIAFISIDHVVDLITNSSSELYVIKATGAKEILLELVNEALKEYTYVHLTDFEDRFFKEGHTSEADWKIQDILESFDEDDRKELKEKYFTNPKYYGLVFDRDWVYNNGDYDFRDKLRGVGFELVDTDY